MFPTVASDQSSQITFEQQSDINMVRNLSRKSSAVFQPVVSQDPLPPLPPQTATLHSGFMSRSDEDMDSALYEYMCNKLEQSRLEQTRQRDHSSRPSFSTADYRQPFEPVEQQQQQYRQQQQQQHHNRLRSQRSIARMVPLTEDAPQTPPRWSQRKASSFDPADYTKPYVEFMTANPTIFHAVAEVATSLEKNGFKKLSERKEWDIQAGGKYYVERNGSSLIAFSVGSEYKAGNGAAIIAGHVDALTAKLKPISTVPNKAGFTQLGVAPYAGALNSTWWDRDLGIGGRVLVREGSKIVSKLVKLDRAIARIPTLAPHFGAPSQGPFNQETQMVPIIGLESSDSTTTVDPAIFKPGTFAATQPPRLVRAIARELSIRESDYSSIIDWELELFDFAPATTGGLDHELIFAGRIDDKLCSWAAIQALLNASSDSSSSGILQVVGLFDDEEIGSLLRQGARGNFLPSTIERAVTSLVTHPAPDLLGRTFANSFLVSSDVTHAVNPNFLDVYLAQHAPRLNVGVAISADSNGHMTTDAVSSALFRQCAEKVGAKVQVFQIRNDSRSGGTVGPMLSAATGMRAIDVGIPQLSMHSIRATTGSLDPGLGVQAFQAFLENFEEVDRAFE